MKLLVFIASIVCLVIGNIILNEYEHDRASTLGMLLLILGFSGLVMEIMMTPPM